MNATALITVHGTSGTISTASTSASTGWNVAVSWYAMKIPNTIRRPLRMLIGLAVYSKLPPARRVLP